uniref:ENT domain-containing protein n=1 Tax=Davidia involucrata TaxID=16924 RepID=A0A5B7AZL4_DAVIN
MRYKKGSRVEVLSENEVPSGSWHYAEVICGNGHNYTVRYVMHPGATDEDIVERVSRKSIRPCPPVVELPENWIPGDVVEVFHSFSWKMATVSKVLGRNYFLVRLLGSSQEFKVSKFDLRVRQSWQDDKWFIIGKGSGNCEDVKHIEHSTLKYNQNLSSQNKRADTRMNLHVKDDSFAVKNINCQESHIVSFRILKRGSSYCYSQVEALAGTAQKFRVTEKEGRRHRVVAANASLTLEKVDAVASPREMLGEKHIYASFSNRTTRFPEMNVEREKPNGTVGCSRAISLEPNDADNVTCSVGSCSITSNISFKLPRHYSTGFVEDTEGHFSDAESVSRWEHEEGNCLLPTKEELAAEIHRLELHAYRCTMEALHASGPLSWEQETLVTNLRLSLHISNDEHLMELRNLISTTTSIPIS